MTKLRLHYYECEHEGDLQRHESDLVDLGVKVHSTNCDPDSETGVIEIEVPDLEAFKAQFKTSNASDFCSGMTKLA